MLTQALGRLFAVAENYPQLKANENFLQLQDELTHTENKVSFARQHYNDTVLEYNNAVTTFPGSIFAGSLGKSRKPMLDIPPADPNVRDEKLLVYRVEEMAVAAGLPTPRVYIQDSRDINAFAAGLTPQTAVICVTRGALEQLDQEELEGVIGHEMSHIANWDVR